MSDQQGQDRSDKPFGDSGSDRIEGVFDEGTGRVKGAAGELTGDSGLQGEGKVDQFTGKAKQGLADAKDAVNDAVKRGTDG